MHASFLHVGTAGDFKRKITAILDQVFPEYDSVFSKVGVFGKASKAALPSLKSLYVQSLSLFTSRSNLFVIVLLFATKSSLSKFNNRVLISYINFFITFYSCSLIASFKPFLSMILNFLLSSPMYGFTREFKVYQSENCNDCPLRSHCTKAKEGNNRRLFINKKWEEQKEYIRTKLSEEETGDIYKKRKIDVEPVFGFLKANLSFTRFSVRGKSKVENELAFALMVVNLRKYTSKIQNKNNPNNPKQKRNCGNNILMLFPQFFSFKTGFVPASFLLIFSISPLNILIKVVKNDVRQIEVRSYTWKDLGIK